MKESTKIKIKLHMLDAELVMLSVLKSILPFMTNAGTVFIIIAAFGLLTTGLLLVSVMFEVSTWALLAAGVLTGLIITIKQQRGQKAQPEETEPCKYCTLPEEYIGISEHDGTRLFVGLSGRNLRLFDEEYPGYIDDLPVNHCPMCGRELHG